MFKNRIRTAAIAGIAALATGVTGTVVATPAFAQVQDGSNATDVEATDRYDLDLARANDAVRDQIEDIAGTEAYENSVINREAFLAGDYDQSEEALIAEYEALRADVQAALAEAVANVDTAREGVLDAEAKDDAVRGALAAYGESAAVLSNFLTAPNQSYTEVVPTQDGEDYVVGNEISGLTPAGVVDEYIESESGGFNTVPALTAVIEDLDALGYAINGERVSPKTTNIVNFDENVVEERRSDGQIDSLQRPLDYIITPSNNDEVEEVKIALEEISTLRDAVAETDEFGRYLPTTYLGQIEAAQDEVERLKTTLEANNEDPIIVGEDGDGLVDPGNDNPDQTDITNPVDTRTSEAQAKKLENLEAYLEGLKAEIEGYVADLDAAEGVYDDAAWAATTANYASRSRALQDATSQRNVLRGLDGYLGAAIKYTELYFDDVLTNDGTLRQQYYDVFGHTPFELRVDENGDGEGFGYVPAFGASAHVKEAVDYVIDGANIGTMDHMLNELSRLGLVEQAVADQAEADKQASDRDQAIIDNLTGSNEAEEDGNGSTGNENIGGGSSFEAPSFGGGSSDLGGFGIAAVIAAIIGVLALVVPNIQNFL